jgi:hypothetical protein
MPIITLKKPVEHDGVTWSTIDLDPTLDAIQAFEEAMARGDPEIPAFKALIAADGSTPIEVAGKMRASDFANAMGEVMGKGPLAGGLPAMPAGEAWPPTSPTS